jgi:hypothetical protein
MKSHTFYAFASCFIFYQLHREFVQCFTIIDYSTRRSLILLVEFEFCPIIFILEIKFENLFLNKITKVQLLEQQRKLHLEGDTSNLLLQQMLK